MIFKSDNSMPLGVFREMMERRKPSVVGSWSVLFGVVRLGRLNGASWNQSSMLRTAAAYRRYGRPEDVEPSPP